MNKSKRTKKSRIGITIIWTLAIILCIPDGIFTTLLYEKIMQSTNSNSTQIFYQLCYPYYYVNHDNPPLYMKMRTIIRFIVYFFVPILIITTFYMMIVVVLLRSFKYTNTDSSLENQTIEEEFSKQKNDEEMSNHNSSKDDKNLTISMISKQNHLARKAKQIKNSFGKVKQSSFSSVYDNSMKSNQSEKVELKKLRSTNSSNLKNGVSSIQTKKNASMRSSTAKYIVHRRHMKGRLKVVKMVLFLVIIFILFCLPEHIYYIVWYFTKIPFNQGMLLFRIMALCAFYTHASIHAYVLFCLSSKFRFYGHNILLKCNERIFSRQNPMSSIRMNIANKHLT